MRVNSAVLLLAFGVALMALCVPDAALSDDRHAWRDDPLGNRFALGAGLFAPRLDTNVRRDSSTGLIGTAIDFESTLGMDDKDRLPLVLGYYRFAKKHRLGFQYFRLDRNGDSVNDAPIRFGDVLVPANFPISSFFNVDVDVDDSDWVGFLKYEYRGPVLAVAVYF